MPRLDQLRRAFGSAHIDKSRRTSVVLGEETLIIDERSKRTPTSLVEEKLRRIVEQATSRRLTSY